MDLSEWLKSRKSLLRQIKVQVRLLLGPPSEDLLSYQFAYKREFRRPWKVTEASVWEQALHKSKVVLAGDFHTFSQSQRLHLRILRSLPKNRKLILGLECIESRFQKILDAYMNQELSEEKFLKEVQWERHWGFPWIHYKPLFECARKKGYKVVALNRYESRRTSKTLARRDAHAAQLIFKQRTENPSHLLYVIFGDLHLAQSHLPHQVKRISRGKIKPLILLQNSEELYFKMARQGMENKVEWLCSSKSQFCHLSSPPWVKWQSYLMYLEQNYDQDLLEAGEELDLTDQVASLIKVLAKDIGVKVSLGELAVYNSDQRSFERWMKTNLKPAELKVAKDLVIGDQSFYLAESGILYLSRLSINHAATLAGWFIHAQLSQRTSSFWNPSQDFQRLLWVEAIGFFFSKLINPKRKAETLRDLKARMTAMSFSDAGRKVLQIALEHRMQEIQFLRTGRSRKSGVRSFKKLIYFEAAKILGEMMGEKVYLQFRTNRLSKKDLIRWLRQKVEDPKFSSFYFEVLRSLEKRDDTSSPVPSVELSL